MSVIVVAMVLYTFDSVGEYPVLESYTTVLGTVTTRVERTGGDAVLRVVVEPHEEEAADAVAAIALPLVAVDGSPQRFELTVDGDASGCRLLLDATDGRGRGLTYSLGIVDFTGVRACGVDVQLPTDVWGISDASSVARITPPLCAIRLVIRLGASSKGVNLGLVELAVTGQVRLAPPGIA